MKDLLDYIKLAHNIQPEHVELVEVKHVPENEKWMLERAEFKMCFNNAFNVVATAKKARYVVGYAMSIIPIEHAWVCVDGVYYDPTWERYCSLGSGYAKVAEFDCDDLIKVVKKNRMTPPSPFDLRRLGYLK